MMWLNCVLLWCLVLVASQAEVVKMTRPIAKVFLDNHNAARSAVGVPRLKWSTSLSKKALKWAAKCQWRHSDTDNGENLYTSTPRSRSNTDVAAKAVKGWVSEKQFSKMNWTCISRTRNTCGHYSQVVWRNTKTVGCAIVHCSGKLANYVVCHYSPSGNWKGQRPY